MFFKYFFGLTETHLPIKATEIWYNENKIKLFSNVHNDKVTRLPMENALKKSIERGIQFRSQQACVAFITTFRILKSNFKKKIKINFTEKKKGFINKLTINNGRNNIVSAQKPTRVSSTAEPIEFGGNNSLKRDFSSMFSFRFNNSRKFER